MSMGGPSIGEFVKAIKRGNEEVVQKYLECGKNPYLKTRNSRLTTLQLAAKVGNEQIMDMLLGSGKMSLDEQTTIKDQTALHIAISFGHEEVAIKLMQAGADKNIRDSNGNTPVHIAAEKGMLALMKHLAISHQGKPAANFALINCEGKNALSMFLFNKPNQKLSDEEMEVMQLLKSAKTMTSEQQRQQNQAEFNAFIAGPTSRLTSGSDYIKARL